MSAAPSLWNLAKRSVQLWVGLLFVPIGILFFAIGVSFGMEERSFAKSGVIASATIVERSLQKADFDKNPSTRYLLRYRFVTAAGAQIEETRQVPVEEWERLAPGSVTQIRYLPSAPSSARVAQESNWGAVAAFCALGLLITAVGAPLLVIAVREVLRQWRVGRTGTTVRAVVSAVVPSSTSINGVRQWEIRYRYKDANGVIHEGRSNCMPPAEAQKWRNGDGAQARIDPKSVDSSVWLGELAPPPTEPQDSM